MNTRNFNNQKNCWVQEIQIPQSKCAQLTKNNKLWNYSQLFSNDMLQNVNSCNRMLESTRYPNSIYSSNQALTQHLAGFSCDLNNILASSTQFMSGIPSFNKMESTCSKEDSDSDCQLYMIPKQSMAGSQNGRNIHCIYPQSKQSQCYQNQSSSHPQQYSNSYCHPFQYSSRH